MKTIAIALPFLCFLGAQAATLQVGPGQAYAKPCAAITAAAAGDTILIDAAGNYSGDVCSWAKNNLTIRGVNGRPRIAAAGANAAGKGIWVIDGNDNVIDNIEFSGATVPDGNGAGIRFEGINLSVFRCYFHNNQNGLLTNNQGAGDLVVQYSEFASNGTGNGYTHNIYVGHIAGFTFQFNYSHDAIGGQLVKSRAAENHILYNRLTTQNGTTSYEIDLPNGGLSYVIGNVVQQGPNGQNSNVMEYLLEGADAQNPSWQLFVVNNTFVNDMTFGTFLAIAAADTTPAVITNNIFAGPGSVTTQSAAVLNANLGGVDPRFVNAAGYDYDLQQGSPAIDTAIAPGMGAGLSLDPADQYLDVACGRPRTAIGGLDKGAFEYGDTAAALACGSNGGTPSLVSLVMSPSAVTGGATSTGSITLDNPAPAAGFAVSLSSSNPPVVSVPASVVVPAGQTQATFTATTGGVATSTAVNLTATAGGGNEMAVVTVNPSTAAAPVFNPPGGTYAAAQSVTLTSATGGASIRYTLDGSTPSPSAGTVYAGPIAIAGNLTVRAVAYGAGLAASPVASASYAIAGSSWPYRKPITVNHAQVAGAVANFPMLVSIADADLAARARPDGSDIFFTAADGVTRLNHELQQYTAASGRLIAWVQVPALSPAADTGIYMYYGNPSAAPQQNPAAVWDSAFQAVWHLSNGAAVSGRDSTTHARNATLGASVSAATGVFGVAANFPGDANSDASLAGLSLGTTYTVSAWTYDTAASGSYHGLWGNASGYQQGVSFNAYAPPTSHAHQFDLIVNSTDRWSPAAYASGAWHYVVTSTASGVRTLYVDGLPGGLVTTGNALTLTDFGNDGQNHRWGGLMQDVRASSGIARSAAWIATEYANQHSPATFLTVGAEQAQ